MGRGIRQGARPWLLRIWPILLAGLILIGCARGTPPFAGIESFHITLTADNNTRALTTTATTVRELLADAGISLNPSDEVSPPLFTPLTDGLTVTVVRVRESVVVIERSVPFSRQIVRSEALSADDPPMIIQGGRAGLEELTVRIVYRDGLESERRTTQVTTLEQAQDEIVMVGIGAAAGNVSFAGMLAYISSGNGLILRGSSAFPEQLDIGGGLDGRVFALSPAGDYLLYTRATTETTTFNSLWLIRADRDAVPRALGVDNVLWAGWNPSRIELPQIAFTTAEATDLPPGWEANNDLWIGDVRQNQSLPFQPEQRIEAYPATYGWWGGSYAWSPTGAAIAYSYADEVGYLDLQATDLERGRVRLQRFTEYNTRGDWAWIPTISWSADGRYLVFSNHGGNNADAPAFNIWAADISGRWTVPFVENAGMWTHPQWSPAAASLIAYLQALTPQDSERSSYALWLMDQDGSNRRQIYPQPGENSRFPRDEQFMAWGPTGRDLAFIFNNALYLYNLDSGDAYPLVQDDSVNSHPTWAPYGAAISTNLRPTERLPLPTPDDTREERLPGDNG
ncbi:MAG: DUF348 domain-containing protein [Anaerolineales bacterium]|nr:DUF348 domain-containing protein [Anaerolineales bacterium]MCB8952656.1 DUF348 domain-containing protein [Ardenticatenales bacterium]